jgi:hypothetical protein
MLIRIMLKYLNDYPTDEQGISNAEDNYFYIRHSLFNIRYSFTPFNNQHHSGHRPRPWQQWLL